MIQRLSVFATVCLGLVSTAPTWAQAAYVGGPAIAEAIAASKSAMLVDPHRAFRLAQTAEALVLQQQTSDEQKVALATSLWLEAEAQIQLDNFGKAKAISEKAALSIEQVKKLRKVHGDIHSVTGTAMRGLGKSPTALVEYLSAFSIYRKLKEIRSQAITLQKIGTIYKFAGSFERAIYYYDLSVETFQGDSTLTLSNSYNKSNALFELDRYPEALIAYRSVYKLASTLSLPRQRLLGLNGIAATQIRLGNADASQSALDQAFALLRSSGEDSYRLLLIGTAADLAMLRHRPALAQRYADQALREAGAEAETQAYRPVQWTAYSAYKAQGNTVQALKHYEIFKRLDDEGRALAASTNAALMAAQFDFANQNARIASLRAGQLERDIKLARLKARQTLLTAVAAIAIIAVIAIGMFITLLALRRSRNRLRAANAELIVVNAELIAALGAKTQFLATTSHEIRTPLNGVLGMTQILLADRTLPPQVRERVTLMQGAGEAMRGLIDDILDFAKLDAGRLEINPLETDLPRLIDETVAFWRGRATEQGLTLTLDRTDCPGRVLHDGRRLQQIVANLLSNAIKFTAAGTVAVRVSVHGAGHDERLEIAVSDTGIGIPAAAHETIFEKFRQLDTGTTRRFGGTGLGLAISQTLARAMGGDVAVKSTLDAGSTFTLNLPSNRIAAAPVMRRREAAVTRPTRLAAAHLLLVGANPAAQGLFRAVLTPRVSGFTVLDALADAAERLATDAADLVLVDATSTAADPDTVRGLVNLADDHDVQVAVLWPAGHDVAADMLGDAGVTVICKPVAAAALLDALEACLQPVHAPRAAVPAAAG